MTRLTLLVTIAIASIASLHAQDRPPFQTDVPAEEFVQRRARVMDAIGTEAIAIVQGCRMSGPSCGVRDALGSRFVRWAPVRYCGHEVCGG